MLWGFTGVFFGVLQYSGPLEGVYGTLWGCTDCERVSVRRVPSTFSRAPLRVGFEGSL